MGVWMVVQITMGVTQTLFAQPVVFGCLEMVVQITIVLIHLDPSSSFQKRGFKSVGIPFHFGQKWQVVGKIVA